MLENEIHAAIAEIVRLSEQKVSLANKFDKSFPPSSRSPRTTADQAKVALEAARLRKDLAELERRIDRQEAIERNARIKLSQLRQSEYRAIESKELQEYRARPVVARGIHITKADLTKAQNSVPQGAFLISVAGIVLIATFAIGSLSLPGWLTILLYTVSLVVTLALGIPQVYIAKKQLDLARAQESRQTVASESSGVSS